MHLRGDGFLGDFFNLDLRFRGYRLWGGRIINVGFEVFFGGGWLGRGRRCGSLRVERELGD